MSGRKDDNRYVLDSFALLSYLENESGADVVRGILEEGMARQAQVFMSVVNFGECIYIIERERGIGAAHKTIAAVGQLPIDISDADQEVTLAAAHVKAHCWVSYADAFAVALAQQKAAVVVTGDPEFKTVEDRIKVLWLSR